MPAVTKAAAQTKTRVRSSARCWTSVMESGVARPAPNRFRVMVMVLDAPDSPRGTGSIHPEVSSKGQVLGAESAARPLECSTPTSAAVPGGSSVAA